MGLLEPPVLGVDRRGTDDRGASRRFGGNRRSGAAGRRLDFTPVVDVMKVAHTAANSFLVEFESEEEFRAEYEANLSARGLSLATTESFPVFSALSLTLRLAGRKDVAARASVVAVLPGAVALSLETRPEDILAALGAPPATPDEDAPAGTVWDRLRAMSRNEKVLYAAKAERPERLVLVQDNDPQVLFYLLKNPRIGVEEVARVAKSPYLTYQVAEVILKTSQWSNHPEVKIALVHNPKTPPAMALKVLPGLPKPEIAKIARGAAVSQALKQAALKLLMAAG